jgi:hypothetical protein
MLISKFDLPNSYKSLAFLIRGRISFVALTPYVRVWALELHTDWVQSGVYVGTCQSVHALLFCNYCSRFGTGVGAAPRTWSATS